MITIRNYRESDFEQLREICRATARDPKYLANKDLVASCYIEPYMLYEADGVFVAADENDVAIGYCCSAADSAEFHQNAIKRCLPRIRSVSRKQALMMRLEPIAVRKLWKQYPAHLHIDILDGYQRQGVGRRLVDAQLEHLRSKGACGVYLGVSADNDKGVPFYRKYGFRELKRLPGCIFFGMTL